MKVTWICPLKRKDLLLNLYEVELDKNIMPVYFSSNCGVVFWTNFWFICCSHKALFLGLHQPLL